MSAGVEAFRGAYADAFREYRLDAGESTLRAAYEVGRQAVGQGLSVLDMALVHHDAMLSQLSECEGAAQLVRQAGEFFLESLAAYEMVQRGFTEARDAALLERRQADMLRRLSSFLADASLAVDASDSLQEMLQIVAEQARELVGASGCVATVGLGGEGETFEAASYWQAGPNPAGDTPHHRGRLTAPFTALDGRALGSLRLFDKQGGPFTAVDEAILIHLAQMVSAAVERARHYRD